VQQKACVFGDNFCGNIAGVTDFSLGVWGQSCRMRYLDTHRFCRAAGAEMDTRETGTESAATDIGDPIFFTTGTNECKSICIGPQNT
jgi:hypothetical protein